MPTLEFKGKQHIYAHYLTVPYRPLVADPGRSLNPAEADGNLIIHGDNLHALKALLPRYAVGHDDELAPFAGQVEQRKWLEDVKDHIADSVSIEPADLQYAPFAQRGAIGRARALFADGLAPLLEELNLALEG